MTRTKNNPNLDRQLALANRVLTEVFADNREKMALALKTSSNSVWRWTNDKPAPPSEQSLESIRLVLGWSSEDFSDYLNGDLSLDRLFSRRPERNIAGVQDEKLILDWVFELDTKSQFDIATTILDRVRVEFCGEPATLLCPSEPLKKKSPPIPETLEIKGVFAPVLIKILGKSLSFMGSPQTVASALEEAGFSVGELACLHRQQDLEVKGSVLANLLKIIYQPAEWPDPFGEPLLDGRYESVQELLTSLEYWYQQTQYPAPVNGS